MKILVTGANGFIGRNLTRHLLAKGHEVFAGVRDVNATGTHIPDDAKLVVADVTLPNQLLVAFEGIDVVINLAAFFNRPEASWEEYREVNINGVKNVLSAAKQCAVKKVIHCSTIGVVAGSGNLPYSEESPYSYPEWDKYETTKCEGEKLALDFAKTEGYPVVIIRPAQVYGVGDNSKAKFYKMVKKGVIVNPGKTLKHLIYIDDLCYGFALAIESSKADGEIIILAGAEALPLTRMIEISAKLLDVKYPSLSIPASLMTMICTIVEAGCNAIKTKPLLFRRSMDFFTRSISCDVSKSKLILGFEAKTTPEVGISKTIEYYQENGMLNK